MTIDHFCINVPSAKLDETVLLYLNAFKPLQYQKFFSSPEATGLGPPNEPELWICPVDSVGVQKYHFALGCKGVFMDFVYE